MDAAQLPGAVALVLAGATLFGVVVAKLAHPKPRVTASCWEPLVSRDWDDRFTSVGGSRVPVPGRGAMSSRKP